MEEPKINQKSRMVAQKKFNSKTNRVAIVSMISNFKLIKIRIIKLSQIRLVRKAPLLVTEEQEAL